MDYHCLTIDIYSFSHFCGLTIEITSSVVLILCVGLGLDYSAHIGVAYLASRARTREGERIQGGAKKNLLSSVTHVPSGTIELCISSPRLVGGRKAGNSSIQTTLQS